MALSSMYPEFSNFMTHNCFFHWYQLDWAFFFFFDITSAEFPSELKQH